MPQILLFSNALKILETKKNIFQTFSYETNMTSSVFSCESDNPNNNNKA